MCIIVLAVAQILLPSCFSTRVHMFDDTMVHARLFPVGTDNTCDFSSERRSCFVIYLGMGRAYVNGVAGSKTATLVAL